MMRIIIRQGITVELSRGDPLFLSKTNLRPIGLLELSYCQFEHPIAVDVSDINGPVLKKSGAMSHLLTGHFAYLKEKRKC